MRMHNLHGTGKEKEENESSDEESDDEEEDEDRKPQLELAMMPHYGGINRIRVSGQYMVLKLKLVSGGTTDSDINIFLNTKTYFFLSGHPTGRTDIGRCVVGKRAGGDF